MGYIDAHITNNNIIELQIMGLQDNGYYLDYGQAAVIIEYPLKAPLYDVIMTIFDKLTDDHQYKLRDIKYNDVIICSDKLVKKYPEKCNYDRNETYVGGNWMPFTKETFQYIDIFDHCVLDYYENDFILLRGKVEYNENNQLEFTYDDPIVSKSMSKEYYNLTRKRIVWDVDQDEDTRELFVKPYYFADINEPDQIEEIDEIDETEDI